MSSFMVDLLVSKMTPELVVPELEAFAIQFPISIISQVAF